MHQDVLKFALKIKLTGALALVHLVGTVARDVVSVDVIAKQRSIKTKNKVSERGTLVVCRMKVLFRAAILMSTQPKDRSGQLMPQNLRRSCLG